MYLQFLKNILLNIFHLWSEAKLACSFPSPYCPWPALVSRRHCSQLSPCWLWRPSPATLFLLGRPPPRRAAIQNFYYRFISSYLVYVGSQFILQLISKLSSLIQIKNFYYHEVAHCIMIFKNSTVTLKIFWFFWSVLIELFQFD